ncbi:MAG: hypothetical protein K2O57_05460, partial [Acetatifactor sp.]|nr:hypothetical protein [Acetatifactor sp.]
MLFMLIIWFFMLIVWAVLAIIPAKIAQDKGYSFSTWYIYGFLLFIVAFIHSLILKNINEPVEMSIEAESLRRIDIPKSNKVDINAKAQIIGYEILHANKGDYYLKLNIQNISNKTITSLKIVATGYNDFHEKILVNSSESFEILVQDLYIYAGASAFAEYPLVQEQNN